MIDLWTTPKKKVKLSIRIAGSAEHGLRKFTVKIKCTVKLENLIICEDLAIFLILKAMKIVGDMLIILGLL